jgi:hypothetical protein
MRKQCTPEGPGLNRPAVFMRIRTMPSPSDRHSIVSIHAGLRVLCESMPQALPLVRRSRDHKGMDTTTADELINAASIPSDGAVEDAEERNGKMHYFFESGASGVVDLTTGAVVLHRSDPPGRSHLTETYNGDSRRSNPPPYNRQHLDGAFLAACRV